MRRGDEVEGEVGEEEEGGKMKVSHWREMEEVRRVQKRELEQLNEKHRREITELRRGEDKKVQGGRLTLFPGLPTV